jgi:hypothetical protein
MTHGAQWGSPWSQSEDRFDHLVQVLEELLKQFDDRPNFLLVVQFLAERFQALEENIFDTNWFRYVDQAHGRNLDLLGILLGQVREGLTDERYRALLKTRYQTLFGRRNVDAMLEVINVVTSGFAITYTLVEDFPATIVVEFLGIDNDTGEFWNRIIRGPKPEGVRLVTKIVDVPDTLLDLDDAAQGWDDASIGLAHSFDAP